MKSFVFCCWITVCVSCVPSAYKLTTLQDVPTESDLRRKKFILLNSRDFENGGRLAAIVNGKKWLDFDQEVSHMNDQKAKVFLQGTKLMVQKDYAGALNQFKSLKASDFDCQVKILVTDCLYELKRDTTNFRRNYQEALDCTTNAFVREMALKRYRFFKYEK